VKDSVSVKTKAILSLVLLVPLPSIGILAAMVFFPDTALGKGIFAISKVGLLALPVLWYLVADKGRLSLSPPRKGGFGVGVISGVLISAVILAVYLLLGNYFLDKNLLIDKMQAIGLATVPAYVVGAVYWIGLNSILEEYVWRWFVVKQAKSLFTSTVSVVFSAMCFTLHHVIAMKVYMPWTATILCSTGIFIGGAVWSWIFVKYQSIWPCYVSHAIVDVCVFGIGAVIIFGSSG